MPSRAVLAISAGWLVLHGLLVMLSRMTAIGPGEPGLVWPAAGTGFLWLLSSRHGVHELAVLVLLFVETWLLLAGTDGGARLSAVTAIAAIVQTWVAVRLVRWWCPGLLGAGGTSSVHDPGTVSRGIGAVTVGTAVGALIGGLGLSPGSASDAFAQVVQWWGSNLVGLIVVGAFGHLLWEWWIDRQRATGAAVLGAPAHEANGRAHRLEAVALVAVSAALYSLVFASRDLPIAFVVVPVAVWVAKRFPTLVAVGHTALFGTVAVFLTLEGRGPFGGLDSPESELLVTQAFLLVLELTVLVVGTARDARVELLHALRSSQEEVAARVELLDAMTEALTEGIILVRPDGTIAQTNPAARAMLDASSTGYSNTTSSYAVRRPDGTPLDPHDLPSRRALREGHVPPHDLIMTSGGVDRVLSATASALHRGVGATERLGAVVVYRDVTDERLQSRELAGFAEVVAHDLRGPLTAAVGWLDLAVLTMSAAQADGRATAMLARARQSTSRMSALIDDLLAQATAVGGELHPTDIDLTEPEDLVADVLADLAEDADVRVDPDVPGVRADPDMVRQLLRNLLGNAVKYTAPGTAPRIVIHGHRTGSRVHIGITDNGIGVPEGETNLVFSRFHRAHADLVTYEGTGLGLAICRTIVERHGGTIVCRPAPGPGSGTTFSFDLPATT